MITLTWPVLIFWSYLNTDVKCVLNYCLFFLNRVQAFESIFTGSFSAAPNVWDNYCTCSSKATSDTCHTMMITESCDLVSGLYSFFYQHVYYFVSILTILAYDFWNSTTFCTLAVFGSIFNRHDITEILLQKALKTL